MWSRRHCTDGLPASITPNPAGCYRHAPTRNWGRSRFRWLKITPTPFLEQADPLEGLLLPPFPGNDVRPQCFDVVGLEQITPRRHVSRAVSYRIDKARVVATRKLAQIFRPLGIGQSLAVACRAVGRVDLRALRDLLRREWLHPGVLCRCAGAPERKNKGERSAEPHALRPCSKNPSPITGH